MTKLTMDNAVPAGRHSPENTDVDKMLADFLAELQALSDSLQPPGDPVAPDSAEQSDDLPSEVVPPVAAQHDVATQPVLRTEGVSDTEPALPVRDIRALLMDETPPSLQGTRRAPQRPYKRAQVVRQWARALPLAGISFVLVCLLGVLYRLDPFGFSGGSKQITPPAPSSSSMPDPIPVSPAVPIGKTLPALPLPPASPSSAGSPPATPGTSWSPGGHTIGVSYRTVTAQLDRLFAMKKVRPIEGQERYVGQTDNHMAALEIIGNKDRVSEACLTARLPGDAPGAAERNVGFAFSFIQNIEPEWVDAPNWIADNLVNLSNSETEIIEIIRGKRRVRLRWSKATGMMSLSVRHEGQKEPITGHALPE